MVKDVYPGPESGGVSELAVVHGSLYFAGYDHQHGLEVWRSDGTADGTALFSDVYPGPASSSPSEFSTAGKFLVFNALSYDGSGFGVWSINLGPALPPAPATSWLLN
jgi:ELWxxDGT repeat protein